MPRYFRGLGGDAISAFDPTVTGFDAWQPKAKFTPIMMVRHILKATNVSPFISLTKSFEIAHDYALASAAAATPPLTWAYVYEIEITTGDTTLYDPIIEIARQFSLLIDTQTYHHDGGSALIAGVMAEDPNVLSQGKKMPGNIVGGPPALTDDIRAISFALRDAEVLAHKHVPPHCVIAKHKV